MAVVVVTSGGGEEVDSREQEDHQQIEGWHCAVLCCRKRMYLFVFREKGRERAS